MKNKSQITEDVFSDCIQEVFEFGSKFRIERKELMKIVKLWYFNKFGQRVLSRDIKENHKIFNKFGIISHLPFRVSGIWYFYGLQKRVNSN